MSTDAADLLGMSNDQLAKVAALVDAARAWVWPHRDACDCDHCCDLTTAVRALDGVSS